MLVDKRTCIPERQTKNVVCSGKSLQRNYGLETFGTPLSCELELFTLGHNLTKEKDYVLV